MLRRVYGVEEPSRLYVSDATEDGLVKYDTRVKRCPTCYVNSYRLGFISVRRPGESWDAAERRVRRMRRAHFGAAARTTSASLGALDPDIRADVVRMLADARRHGFALRVKATYRSPEREAMLMARGRGATHTLTSLHSYGRAIDIVIGDGRVGRPGTRAKWVAFRRWVTTYKGDEFRILGTPEKTWDWPHVEVPSSKIGFHTVEAVLDRARACGMGRRGMSACDFAPHLR